MNKRIKELEAQCWNITTGIEPKKPFEAKLNRYLESAILSVKE